MRPRFSSLTAALLVGASTISASAQDVVMRRPLPTSARAAPGTGAMPTPTPVASPTNGTDPGSEPTPSPPATSTQTPTPTPTAANPDAVGEPFFGWRLDCTARTLTCMSGTTRAAETLVRVVDPSVCPASQSEAGNEQARAQGWTPPGAGIDEDTGTSICDGGGTAGSGSSWPRRVSVATVMCEDGSTSVACTGLSFDAQDDVDQASPSSIEPRDLAACRAQRTDDPVYLAIRALLERNEPGVTVLPSDVDARSGAACASDEARGVANGSTCRDGQPLCMRVDYAYADGAEGRTYSVEGISIADDQATCSAGTGIDDDQREVLALAGLTPPGGESCTPTDVYAATGSCRTTTRYEAGWPSTGQAHVETTFALRCYAVRGLGTGTPTVSELSDASPCERQRLSPSQKAIVDSLAPELHDPATLVRSCSASGSLVLHYQRDSVPTSGRLTSRIVDTFSEREREFGPQRTADLIESSGTYPFVCTDLEPGDGERPSYFDPARAYEARSDYPVTRSPCDAQHLGDADGLSRGRDPYSGRVFDLQGECRDTLGAFATPARIAQCGTTAISDGRGSIAYRARRWIWRPM